MRELDPSTKAVLVCPACGRGLDTDGNSLSCHVCPKQYPVVDGIPQLFYPHEKMAAAGDVTEVVKAFYEVNPFPNYDDFDSRESLRAKANTGVFARLLDEQIPHGALVLEAGCGTGQLSNFLGMSWKRQVVATDLCLNSLRLANGFRERFDIANVTFFQMNLFRPAFRPESFDVVISNGVLHHTADPLGAFQSIARLVKPGGVIVIGLYNKIGRLTTDARRLLFRIFGDGIRFLDAHMRNKTYNEDRKRAWFMDQYKHPHESKHTYSELLHWMESNGFEFLSAIPKIGGAFTDREQLFQPHDKGTPWSRFTTELEMLMSGGQDGALYIMIGRKVGTPAASPQRRA